MNLGQQLEMSQEVEASGRYRLTILGDVLALLIPSTMFIEIQLGGSLFLSEVLLAAILPLLFVKRGRLLFEKWPRRILVLGLIWLFAQILTDQIRSTPFEDWTRGWAKIIFLLIDFSAIYLLLVDRERRYFLFAAGIAFGQILQYFYNPDDFALSLPWKFGYGSADTLLVILAASSYFAADKGRLATLTTMMIMGGVNFYLGFRSLAAVCLLSGWMLLLTRSRLTRTVSVKKVAMLSALAIVGIVALYDFGATNGYFGEKEKEKYLMQSSGEMGVLVGGRSEILASAHAVRDSPIIGHGSWAKDPKYSAIMADDLADLGYEVVGVAESELIPSHSYFMGAWVEAGIAGAIFWLAAFVLTTRALIASLGTASILAPLVIFEGFKFLWDIPFSPFGAEARLYAAYHLALMMFAASWMNLRKPGGAPE